TQATRLVLRLPLIDHGRLSVRDSFPGTRAVVVGLGRSEVPVHGVHEGFLSTRGFFTVSAVFAHVILRNQDPLVMLRERPETYINIKVLCLVSNVRCLEPQRVRVRGCPYFRSIAEMALYDLRSDVEESPTPETPPDLLQRVPEVAEEILVRV